MALWPAPKVIHLPEAPSRTAQRHHCLPAVGIVLCTPSASASTPVVYGVHTRDATSQPLTARLAMPSTT
jgi:hypothetical protein